MAKMSIHIPDDVLHKVRMNKGRLNISRICSSALLREVENLSTIPSLVDDTKRLLDRLQGELNEREADSFSLGVKLAQGYLSKVSHEQLENYYSMRLSDKRRIVFPEEIENYLERLLLEKKVRRLNREAFSKGWLVVMKRTWETVRDRIR